ncbi:MAG: hypothetical protein MN733_41170 [Nitrososphaera sp.]|nr:hypothetical protein [Nitrososphaera sp.]
MKLSEHLRDAAAYVADKPNYNSMCLAIWHTRPDDYLAQQEAEDFISDLYHRDANKYHGHRIAGYWFGPTEFSCCYPDSPADHEEYRQMRVLALLFAACIAKDEGN